MTPDELREKVARAMWMADVEPYDPADRIPLEDAMESARAYVYAEADAAVNVVLEEVAAMIERKHGYGMSRQIAKEVRAMKGNSND